MTETVIVPLDGSDGAMRAVPVGRTLAETFGAELVLMTTPATLDRDRMDPPVWLEDAATALDFGRVRTEMTDAMRAVDGVAVVVAASPDPLVCMATHGRGVLGTTILGSVAQDVVRSAGAPVVLVGPHCAESAHGGTGPVLVGHDGSASSDAVLPAARDWARAAGRSIVVVHVFHPLDVESARELAPSVSAAVDYLREAVPDVELRVERSSYPVGAILDLAHELDVAALAVSTHGRSGLARMTLGSVAASLVHAAPCPVLVTRPPELT